jgi:nicotinamidase-related amidase
MASRPNVQSETKHPDLHGNAPDQCEVALLLIDVINDLSFEGGERLLEHALPAARELAALKRRAAEAGVPVIYANDNFGRWRSDFSVQVRHVREDGTRGGPIVELLAPGECDYFVLKPKHSAFYQTCLGVLLEHLGVKTLLIGGFATDSCVQLTAGDAFLRGFNLLVLNDGCATQGSEAHESSLEQMKRVLSARIVRCEQVRFTEQENGASIEVVESG